MFLRFILVVGLCGFLFACSSEKVKEEEPAVEDLTASSASDDSGATSYGADQGSSSGLEELNNPSSILAQRIIYFEYDSSEVQPEYRSVIEAHSSLLVRNPGTTITLEGHGDERGSREYNLALGERRALAIRQQMGLLGVPADQIRVVSYGEERPAVDGHDESAWSRNRRVEIIY